MISYQLFSHIRKFISNNQNNFPIFEINFLIFVKKRRFLIYENDFLTLENTRCFLI